MIRFLLRLWAGRLCRLADQIDREYPPPHFPNTLGAEYGEFAGTLRKFAAELRAA